MPMSRTSWLGFNFSAMNHRVAAENNGIAAAVAGKRAFDFVIIRCSAMTVVTFQDKLISCGARLATYCGAETPASFGDSPSEFRALLSRAAIFDMSWQAKLQIGGKDRMRWANGMVTNNIRDLESGRGVYGFILTPQGKNQGDLVLYNRGDYLLATTDRAQVEAITT